MASTDRLFVTASTALDADGALRAAAGAELAQGLMLAASLVLAVVATLVVARRRKPSVVEGSESGGGVPWSAVLAGASIVALAGGGIGLWSTSVSSRILNGGGSIGSTLGNRFGLWSLVVTALGLIGIAVGALVRHGRRVPRIGSAVLLPGALVALIGTATASELPRPERQVTATVPVSGSVQASVVMTPGAAGPNDVRVSLSGPDAEVRMIRQRVSAGGAKVSLRPLSAQGEGMSESLGVDEEGSVVATDVVADGSGRARVTIVLASEDPIVVDVTLQSNPAHTT